MIFNSNFVLICNILFTILFVNVIDTHVPASRIDLSTYQPSTFSRNTNKRLLDWPDSSPRAGHTYPYYNAASGSTWMAQPQQQGGAFYYPPQQRGVYPGMQPVMVPAFNEQVPLGDSVYEDDYEEENEDEVPVKVGDVGLSFGFSGNNGWYNMTSTIPPIQWDKIFGGLMGGVAGIVQASAQKDMMTNFQKLMLLKYLTKSDDY